jgi:CheY-like chemotaxis protein
LVDRSDPDLPDPIISDSLRLRQILLNLLSNAVKFTDKGTVTLETKVTGDEIVFAVQDSGIGIEQDRLDAIFNPFEQADNATSRKFGGTGLGLTISRHLAELLGGSLSATSKPSEGSRFELTLPLIEPELTKPATHAGPEAAAADPTNLIAGSRILLAEDHDINQMLVTAMLEKCGQSVEVAEDGEQAVAAVMEAQASGAPFDLILMDIQMPECDGYTATATLRELGISAEQLPIVALTANAFDDDVQAAKNAGMQGHLAKPLRFSALVETLQRHLPTTGPEKSVPVHAASDAAPLEVLPDTSSAKPSLEQRWRQRRGEAIDAVSEALRKGEFDGEPAEELARVMHKLAGTAGMFGEDRLGAKAGALERSLKASTDVDTRIKLAADLLKVA